MQQPLKLYMASDFHLGIPNKAQSRVREKQILKWLDFVRRDATHIYLLGDLFDFWFEYKHVVPKGYVRFLGKLAELADEGIIIEVFTGNHDMWMFGYFQDELGIEVHHQLVLKNFGGQKMLIGHGDGIGPGDHGYKFLKSIFKSKPLQWLFARLHPNFAFSMANYFSRRSRNIENGNIPPYQGDDKEFIVQFCKKYHEKTPVDYFVFGHRHLPLDMKINGHAHYLNLGDWITHHTYACYDGLSMELKTFKHEMEV